MIYENIIFKTGDTLAKIAGNYGYDNSGINKIWDHSKNTTLKKKRVHYNNLKSGDILIVPIPWKITSKQLSPNIKRHGGQAFRMEVSRNGEKGTNLRWVQTIYADNQSLYKTPFGVDLEQDDDKPFYYNDSELFSLPSRRTNFYDAPWRKPHPIRTTSWRAVLSIGSVFEKRVSIFETIVWGINFGKDGKNSPYPPRKATSHEIHGHLRLLKIGRGLTKSFKDGGWTFREAIKY